MTFRPIANNNIIYSSIKESQSNNNHNEDRNLNRPNTSNIFPYSGNNHFMTNIKNIIQ